MNKHRDWPIGTGMVDWHRDWRRDWHVESRPDSSCIGSSAGLACLISQRLSTHGQTYFLPPWPPGAAWLPGGLTRSLSCHLWEKTRGRVMPTFTVLPGKGLGGFVMGRLLGVFGGRIPLSGCGPRPNGQYQQAAARHKEKNDHDDSLVTTVTRA